MWKPLDKNAMVHSAQSKERMKAQRARITRRRQKYALASVVDNLLTRICIVWNVQNINELPQGLVSDVNRFVSRYGHEVSDERPTPFEQDLFNSLIRNDLSNREALIIVRDASASLAWSQSDASLFASSSTIVKSSNNKKNGVHKGINIWSSDGPKKLSLADLLGESGHSGGGMSSDEGSGTEDEGIDSDNDGHTPRQQPVEIFPSIDEGSSSPPTFPRQRRRRRRSSISDELKQEGNDDDDDDDDDDGITSKSPISTWSPLSSRKHASSSSSSGKKTVTIKELVRKVYVQKYNNSRESTAGSLRRTPQLKVNAGKYKPGWRSSFMPLVSSFVDHPPAPRAACVLFNYTENEATEIAQATSQAYNLAVLLHTKIGQGSESEPGDTACVKAFSHYKHALTANPNNAAALYNMAILRTLLRTRNNHVLNGEKDPEELYEQCYHIAFHAMNKLKTKCDSQNHDKDDKNEQNDSLLKHGAEMMKRLAVSTLNNLGNLAAVCDHDDKAMEFYRNALRLDPKDVRAIFNLACIQHRKLAADILEKGHSVHKSTFLEAYSHTIAVAMSAAAESNVLTPSATPTLSSQSRSTTRKHEEEEEDENIRENSNDDDDEEVSLFWSSELSVDHVLQEYSRVLGLWPQCRMAHLHIGMLIQNLGGDVKHAYFHYNQVLELSKTPSSIMSHADWPPPRYVTETQEGVQAVSNAKAAEVRASMIDDVISTTPDDNNDASLMMISDTGNIEFSDNGVNVSKNEIKTQLASPPMKVSSSKVIEDNSTDLPFPDRRSQLAATLSDETRVAYLMVDAHTKLATIDHSEGRLDQALDHLEKSLGMVQAWKTLPDSVVTPLIANSFFNIAVAKQGQNDHHGAVEYFRKCLDIDPKAEDVGDAHVGAAISLRAQALVVTEDLEDGDPEVVFAKLIILDTLTEEHLKIAMDPDAFIDKADSGDEEFAEPVLVSRNRALPVRIPTPPPMFSHEHHHHDLENSSTDLKKDLRVNEAIKVDKNNDEFLDHESQEIDRIPDEEVSWKMVAEAEFDGFLQVKVPIPQILLEEVKEGPRLKTWQIKKKKSVKAKP